MSPPAALLGPMAAFFLPALAGVAMSAATKSPLGMIGGMLGPLMGGLGAGASGAGSLGNLGNMASNFGAQTALPSSLTNFAASPAMAGAGAGALGSMAPSLSMMGPASMGASLAPDLASNLASSTALDPGFGNLSQMVPSTANLAGPTAPGVSSNPWFSQGAGSNTGGQLSMPTQGAPSFSGASERLAGMQSNVQMPQAAQSSVAPPPPAGANQPWNPWADPKFKELFMKRMDPSMGDMLKQAALGKALPNVATVLAKSLMRPKGPKEPERTDRNPSRKAARDRNLQRIIELRRQSRVR